MKMKFLSLLFIVYTQAFANTQPYDDDYQKLLDRHHFNKVDQAIQAKPEYQNQPKLIKYRAEALLALGKTEQFNQLVSPALAKFPLNAELHQLAARNKFNQAQEAFFFRRQDMPRKDLPICLKPKNSMRTIKTLF